MALPVSPPIPPQVTFHGRARDLNPGLRSPSLLHSIIFLFYISIPFIEAPKSPSFNKCCGPLLVWTFIKLTEEWIRWKCLGEGVIFHGVIFQGPVSFPVLACVLE